MQQAKPACPDEGGDLDLKLWRAGSKENAIP